MHKLPRRRSSISNSRRKSRLLVDLSGLFDGENTRFSSQHWLYQFNCMPFGLGNHDTTFTHVMDIISSSFKRQISLVYLDDTVIFSRILSEHSNFPRLVLYLLIEAGVTLKLRTCECFTNSIDYLGHLICPGRLEVANHATDARPVLKKPTTKTIIPSFIVLFRTFSALRHHRQRDSVVHRQKTLAN